MLCRGLGWNQIVVRNRREKCWSKPDLWLCWRSRVHDKELRNSGCVLSASAWTAHDEQTYWLTWGVIWLWIGQK